MKPIRKIELIIVIALLLSLLSASFAFAAPETGSSNVIVGKSQEDVPTSSMKLSDVKAYSGEPFVAVNNNVPDFYIWQLTTTPFVLFSPLDKNGRTGPAIACLSKELMPTESRMQAEDVKPSGWDNARYDDLIETQYLYNRSHVIGYQFCGDNGSKENLFTGTAYLNTETMLYFEDMVANYINQTENGHVIYRVTPMYDGKNLVAKGVQMEALSVEDFGKSVCFNVFVYNVQPGIKIDYASGKSSLDSSYKAGSEISAAAAFGKLSIPFILGYAITDQLNTTEQNKAAEVPAETVEETVAETAAETQPAAEPTFTYVLNKNTGKFHYPTCSSVNKMKEKNKEYFEGTREDAINRGYSPCGNCHP